MNKWHVVQIRRNMEQSAAFAIAGLGLEAYVPLLRVTRVAGGRSVERNVARFGIYIFANFDRDVPGWQGLHHAPAKRAGVARVLCDGEGRPLPVPGEAMVAMRSYMPEPIALPAPYRYQPGEPVVYTLGGQRREAVFVEYCGNRPMVRTWIFGAERVTEVSSTELEPVDKGERLPTMAST